MIALLFLLQAAALPPGAGAHRDCLSWERDRECTEYIAHWFDKVVSRKAYWYPSTTREMVFPCIPSNTKTVTQDTPTIFRAKCPKGWKPTMVYYKGPTRK